jgi:hypothetical protein
MVSAAESELAGAATAVVAAPPGDGVAAACACGPDRGGKSRRVLMRQPCGRLHVRIFVVTPKKKRACLAVLADVDDG